MGLFGTKNRTVVVSIDDILKSKGARGNIAPRQQLQVLRSLSRLVVREKMNVTAVITGDPLNKAPHNTVFDGVRVRYAKSQDSITGELIKAIKQAGSNGVMVTSDVELEKKLLRKRIDTLRISTFSKLIEDGIDSGNPNANPPRERNPNERTSGERTPGERPNNRRDRGPRPERKKDRGPKPEKQQDPEREQDDISQMIDLVD